MRPYERYSLIVAAGLSIAVHASVVVYFMQHGLQLLREQPPPARTMQISMTFAQPRPVRAVPVAEPVPRRVPQLVPPGPQPAPRLQTVPASDRVARPAPVPPPAPAAAAIAQALPAADALTTAADSKAMVQHPLPDVPKNAQETYLQQLLAHIDSHKFYPRSARRRGLEGEIKVSFTLLADGSIRALQVNGGSRVLREAAERAVLSAQPMPTPPAALGLREQISFGMVFRLG